MTSSAGLATGALRPRQTTWQRLLHFVRHKPLGTVGAVIIIAMMVIAICAGWLFPAGPNVQSRTSLRAPSAQFPLGTDNVGRDVLTRIVYGTRTSLSVGLVAVGIGIVFGALIGLVSGYAGGLTDMIMQRVVDSIMAFPGLVLALTTVAVLGRTTINVMIAVGIGFVPGVARVVRGSVLAAKENQYVEAARCTGCRSWRILFRHIMPNTVAPVIILATAGLGGAIVAEATLSYLGLGPPPPTPTWGGMMQAGRTSFYYAWWNVLYPGIAISIAVYAFNFFGDAIRDVLDPRLRGGK